MRSPRFTRILIVAHQTADSRELIEMVARRAAEGWCTFTLLVPASAPARRGVEPEDQGVAAAEACLALALPLLSEAAGEEVLGVLGAHEPLAAVQDALNLLGFDEVIVSTLPAHTSAWLRLGLAGKIGALGVPVTVVTAGETVSRSPAA